jgi:hypothetical protein
VKYVLTGYHRSTTVQIDLSTACEYCCIVDGACYLDRIVCHASKRMHHARALSLQKCEHAAAVHTAAHQHVSLSSEPISTAVQ